MNCFGRMKICMLESIFLHSIMLLTAEGTLQIVLLFAHQLQSLGSRVVNTIQHNFPRWENYLRWKHKAAENWINISPKLLVLNWIALICLLRRLFVGALLLRRWHAGLWPIDRGLHIAEMYIRYALWLQPETMYLRCLHSSYIYLIVIRFSESLDNNMIQKCIITMQLLQYDI